MVNAGAAPGASQAPAAAPGATQAAVQPTDVQVCGCCVWPLCGFSLMDGPSLLFTRRQATHAFMLACLCFEPPFLALPPQIEYTPIEYLGQPIVSTFTQFLVRC